MTREEAIFILKRDNPNNIAIRSGFESLYDKREEAFLMAIKALEQEPCEDAISRKWLKNAIHNFYKGLVHTPTEEDIQAYIDVAPSVKPQYTEAEIQKIQELEQAQLEKAYEIGKAEQQKIGHWSRKTKVDAYDIAGVKTWGIKCQCDKCDFTTTVVEGFGYYKYCPNCGAKMQEVEE